jgi:hypothetical protein
MDRTTEYSFATTFEQYYCIGRILCDILSYTYIYALLPGDTLHSPIFGFLLILNNNDTHNDEHGPDHHFILDETW